ncbi:MAG TPA: hypothetical protein VEY95_02625 [Azospirillaceae bacterium]|nr:hypothetical protein [Azospirillaceae bacterium]
MGSISTSDLPASDGSTPVAGTPPDSLPLNEDTSLLREQIRRLQDELDMERICHSALKAVVGSVLDEACAHPDTAGLPLANDQDAIDEVYRYALRATAKKMGREYLLYSTGAEYQVAKNRAAMERQQRMRDARMRILDVDKEILDLLTLATEMRERMWQDSMVPVKRTGLFARSYLNREYPNRASARIAKERHLAMLEEKRQNMLKRIETLQREIRRLEGVAKGWTS